MMSLFISLNSEASITTINSSGVAGANQFISAINFSNGNPGIDTIHFNIAGAGPHIIPLTVFLPAITEGLVIDAFSQPGNDTISWSIRFSGNVRFTINTGNFTIRGTRLMNTQPQNTYPRAFSISNSIWPNTINLPNLNFDRNYIENYYMTFDYFIDDSGSFPTVNNLRITGNQLYNNYYGLETPSAWFNVSYSDYVISGNYVVDNTYCNIYGNNQTAPHNFLIENNYFFNSILGVSSVLNTALITGNNFQGLSYIDFKASPDSVLLDNNYFGNGTNGIVTFLRDTLNNRLYITNNKIYCKTNVNILLDVGGAGSTHYAENIFINNNDIIGEGIKVRISVTSGSAKLSQCEIANNTITYDTVGFIAPLINVSVSSTGGTAIADSIDIHDNYINGFGIEYEQTGTSSGTRYGEKLYIRKNTIVNSMYMAGIQLSINKNTIRKFYIDSNTVSNSKTGVLVSSQVFSGYSAAIKQIHITRNTLMLNDSVGIALMSLPWNGNLSIDTINISGNLIDSNGYDGIRMWTTMDSPGHTNNFSNIKIDYNTISNNSGHGILFENYGSTTGNFASPVLHHLTYSRNSIFNNSLLGIKINNFNDPGYPVSPMFPVPVITSISSLSGTFKVNGYIIGSPDTNYVIELFRNSSADPSGFGEGETYMEDSLIMTNSNGDGYFSIELPGSPGNWFYSATATQLNSGNTSEFSNAADFTVGIKDNERQDFSIYPNPSSGSFHVHGMIPGVSYNFELTDLLGNVLIKLSNTPEELIIPQLNSGTYLISIQEQDNVVFRSKVCLINE